MKWMFAVLFIIFSLTSFCYSKTQKEEYQNDYLYSAEYFDYLIECAENDAQNMKNDDTALQNGNNDTISADDEISLMNDENETFKLRVEQKHEVSVYKDSFKKIDSKTLIPITNKFSIVHDSIKTRNKYNSNDYKIISGAELQLLKYVNLSSGLETNYRGLDQNPTSRKIYFNQKFSFNDRLSLNFYNKMNMQNYSTDHDVGLFLSPFKSKVIDFGVYSGLTRKKDGTISESINFSTNFYF